MISQSDCIVGFKNMNIVNVLQSSLIVIQYAFEWNSWLFIVVKLFRIVGLNFFIEPHLKPKNVVFMFWSFTTWTLKQDAFITTFIPFNKNTNSILTLQDIEFKMIDVRMWDTYLQVLGNCKKGGTWMTLIILVVLSH
jgi:hypothetical protein